MDKKKFCLISMSNVLALLTHSQFISRMTMISIAPHLVCKGLRLLLFDPAIFSAKVPNSTVIVCKLCEEYYLLSNVRFGKYPTYPDGLNSIWPSYPLLVADLRL